MFFLPSKPVLPSQNQDPPEGLSLGFLTAPRREGVVERVTLVIGEGERQREQQAAFGP